MRIKNICLFVLLNVMVVFTSCSDDKDDSLKILDTDGVSELTEANVGVGENWIRVGGGDGGYSVSCKNKEIAEVSISGNILEIRAYQLGVTEIMLTDRGGEQVTIPLNVRVKESVLKVKYVGAYAEIEDVDARTEIENEVSENLPVLKGGSYKLTLEKWFRKRFEGKLIVYPEASTTKSFAGTFIWDETGEQIRVTFEYNDGKHIYGLPVKGLPKNSSEVGNKQELIEMRSISRESSHEKTYYMGEDVTSQYLTRYPDVERVLALEQISYYYWN